MNINVKKNSKTWIVYILRCSDGSLYTGITNNIEKRLAAHHQGKAAKYTRSRRPLELLATGAAMERSAAMRLEIKIKRQPKEKKLSALKKHAPKKSSTAAATSKARIVAGEDKSLFSPEALKAAAGLWQVSLKKIHRKIPVQGSPERSAFRVVLEDRDKRFFVLEQIASQSVAGRKQIAAILDLLAAKNLPQINPYLTDEKGNHLLEHQNNFWQLSPFVPGVELNREKYIFDKWRGTALADFLIALRRKSQKMTLAGSRGVFSLRNYIYKLVREINLYNKDIKNDINSVVGFLDKDFLPAYEQLPVAFCHGDYHPLNMIWSTDSIRCVIDWEFCGLKSELYDVANLIGCVGMENPHSLSGNLVGTFTGKMKKSGLISKTSWTYLPEFIIALRFAWLAEWLRRKDRNMIRLERDYMKLLMDNKTVLQKAWL
ncbi:MAG TPA: phosphotransferase [Smithella sp.]|nr:phosphotransferase [Smithella sp.]